MGDPTSVDENSVTTLDHKVGLKPSNIPSLHLGFIE